MSWSVEAFKEKLENEYTFPVVYIFKFIVPLEKQQELEGILPIGERSYRKSKTNKYVSLTLKKKVKSSDEVIEVYNNVYQIKGIIAL